MIAAGRVAVVVTVSVLVPLAVSTVTPTVVAGPAAAAGPATLGVCSGVAVIVDFSSLGGGVQSRCVARDPSSGLAALSAAGFSYGLAPSGLVCQISGQPDPCPPVPPMDAYWSYWHVTASGSWTYGSTGANSHDPAPGTVEGWSFGAGDPPGTAPLSGAAPPAPDSGPTPAGSHTAGDDGAAASAGGGVPDVLGLVAGVVLVGGLGGLAWWTARRRGRARPPEP